MTPDKIEEGFEAWFLKSHGYKPEQLVIPESVNPLRKAWQASAEWMLSQAVSDFSIDLVKKCYREQGGNFDGILSDQLQQTLIGLSNRIFVAARLSSAKEIAEKDALIERLKNEIEYWKASSVDWAEKALASKKEST